MTTAGASDDGGSESSVPVFSQWSGPIGAPVGRERKAASADSGDRSCSIKRASLPAAGDDGLVARATIAHRGWTGDDICPSCNTLSQSVGGSVAGGACKRAGPFPLSLEAPDTPWSGEGNGSLERTAFRAAPDLRFDLVREDAAPPAAIAPVPADAALQRTVDADPAANISALRRALERLRRRFLTNDLETAVSAAATATAAPLPSSWSPPQLGSPPTGTPR